MASILPDVLVGKAIEPVSHICDERGTRYADGFEPVTSYFSDGNGDEIVLCLDRWRGQFEYKAILPGEVVEWKEVEE